jgi:hypothetical protein
VGNSDAATTVDVVAAWVLILAPFFAIVLQRGFFTGVTSVVSGAYFLAGPLLFGYLFGVSSVLRPDRMFLEKLRQELELRFFVFLLNIHVL